MSRIVEKLISVYEKGFSRLQDQSIEATSPSRQDTGSLMEVTCKAGMLPPGTQFPLEPQ